MTWFWQRKSDKQAECDTSLALWLPPKTFSNPILIRCMCKQLMCHALNKQRLVFCELIAPKIHSDCPVLSTGRDVKDGWVPHVMDHRPSAFGCPSPADSHLLKSSRWGSHCQIPSTTTSWSSSNKCLGCCKLSSPLLDGHSKPEVWLSSLEWQAMDIAVEASDKPWMFDLNSILLVKSSISQLKAASTPSSLHVPSTCLPSPFLCILILCMSEECGKCGVFRLPQ